MWASPRPTAKVPDGTVDLATGMCTLPDGTQIDGTQIDEWELYDRDNPC